LRLSDSEARRHTKRDSFGENFHTGDATTQSFCQFQRATLVGLREHDQKLLASPTAHDVGATDGARDLRNDGDEDVIARQVPVLVVHRLEVIEIQHQDGKRWAASTRARQFRVELSHDVSSVECGREWVRERQAFELSILLPKALRGRDPGPDRR
jgi:hypothetical protein